MSKLPRSRPIKVTESFHATPEDGGVNEILVAGKEVTETDLAAISLMEDAAKYFSEHPDAEENFELDVLLLNEAAARLHEMVDTGVPETDRANRGGALDSLSDEKIMEIVSQRAARRYVEKSTSKGNRFDNKVPVGHEAATALGDAVARKHVEDD